MSDKRKLTDTGRGLTLPECCLRYLRSGITLLGEWMNADYSGVIGRDSYREAHAHVAGLLDGILQGTPCPWHDEIPEDYLRVMAFMGGDDGHRPVIEGDDRPITDYDREEGWL